MTHGLMRTIVLSATLTLPLTGLAAEQLNVLCASDNDWCELMRNTFQKESGIEVSMVRKSAGEIFAQIRAEASNPKTDIWWAGTGDPHLQAAAENLTLEYKSSMLAELNDWAVKQAESSGYKTVGVYAGALGWGFNTEIFTQKNLKEPKCWADLLDPSFKGEIQIAKRNNVLPMTRDYMAQAEARLDGIGHDCPGGPEVGVTKGQRAFVDRCGDRLGGLAIPDCVC